MPNSVVIIVATDVEFGDLGKAGVGGTFVTSLVLICYRFVLLSF